MALAREELGAIEAAGFDADEDVAWLGGGDGDGFEVEGGGTAGAVDDGCEHGFWGGHFCCVLCVCVCVCVGGLWRGWWLWLCRLYA